MSISLKSYSEIENQFLKENYRIIGPKVCSQRLGRTYSSVCSQSSRLGLLSNKFKIPINSLNKICCKCQEEKLKSFFGLDKGRKDGLNPICKPCIKIITNNQKQQKSNYDKKYRNAASLGFR